MSNTTSDHRNGERSASRHSTALSTTGVTPVPVGPQLFLPADCTAMLAVGGVQQRNLYWRLAAIDTEVDFSSIVDETKPPNDAIRFGIGRARLGLPLSLIAPSWSKWMPAKAVQNLHQQPITVSADGTFLPAIEPEAMIASRGRAPVVVRDLDKAESGQLVLEDRTRLSLAPAAMHVLLAHAQAYARRLDADGKPIGLIPVVLDAEEIEIDETRDVPSRLSIPLDGRPQVLPLAQAERDRLASGHSVILRSGNRAVRVSPRRRDASASTLVRSNALIDALRGVVGNGSLINRPGIIRIVDKDDPPWDKPFRVLPRFEIGIATPIVQQWELLGYERGPLVGSIVLEPGAEATVEVFTWERLRIQREEESGTTFERNAEVSALARASSRVSMDTASELGTTFNFGGGATIPVEAVSAKLTASVETETSINANVQSGLDRVMETTRKSAEKFQATHQVKVIHTTERGTETRSTRRITNPNAGHTLEFLHFAIQERHKVTTRVGGKAKLVAFVENPAFGAFDVNFVFAHEHVLKAALLSEDYRAGFDAARTIAAQGWFEESLAKKEKERLAALTSDAEAPEAESEEQPGLPKTGIYQTARQIKNTLREFLGIDLAVEANILACNLNPFLDKEQKPGKKRVKKAEARFARWSFWAKFTMAYPGIEDKAAEFVKVRFDGEDHSSEEDVLAALQQLTDGLDDDWVAAIKMIAVAVLAGTAASLIGGPLSGVLQPVLIGLLLVADDMGLPRAITRARQELQSERALQHGQTLIAAPAPAESTEPAATPLPPPPPQIVTDAELANAQADFGKLKQHLEAHRSYYENAVWLAEDASDRYVRLEAMGVAPFVENVLVGFVGNRAMYPLRLESLPLPTQTKLKSVIGKPIEDDYEAEFDVKTEEIVLPTPAVHCEAYMGACELLEPYLVRRREIDLVQREAQAAHAQALAEQERHEAARLAARLSQTPPLLDNARARSRKPHAHEPTDADEGGAGIVGGRDG